MSTASATFGPSSAPTSSHYSLESPFSFNLGSNDFGESTFSPDMSRYLRSPTPPTGENGGAHDASHQPHFAHTPQSQTVYSPNSFNIGNLSLRSPTGPLPQTQPIPIHTPQYHAAGHAYAGASSSLPHQNGYHGYHPYARPGDAQPQYLFRSPPGSSRSVNSGPLSPALVSPMTDLGDISPLPVSYYGQAQYIASPLTGHGGMSSPDSAQQPRALGRGASAGLGIDIGTAGLHFPPSNGMGFGQIPQYPPGTSRRGRGPSRPKGLKAKRRVSGETEDGMAEGEGLVKKEEGEGEAEGDDEDAEGESVPGDNAIGTHKSHLEKRRRLIIKAKFAALADLLEPIPAGSGKGSTKVNTLDRATKMIQEYKSALNTISLQNQQLNDELVAERQKHAATQRLNAELSRALAAGRSAPNGQSGVSPT